MMLFLYALLYFALSNAIAAAPVWSNVKGRGLNPAAEPFTSLAAPTTWNIEDSNSNGKGVNPAAEPFTPAVQSTGFQSPTRNIEEEPRPVQKTRKSGSEYKTVHKLKLKKGSIYSIPRQLVDGQEDPVELVPFVYIGPVPKIPVLAFVSMLSVPGPNALQCVGDYKHWDECFNRGAFFPLGYMVRTGGVQVAMAQELQPEKGFESATLTTEMLEKITTDMEKSWKAKDLEHRGGLARGLAVAMF